MKIGENNRTSFRILVVILSIMSGCVSAVITTILVCKGL